MTTLNARYGFKEPRTRFVQRPDDPLYRAFNTWIELIGAIPASKLPGGKFLYQQDIDEAESNAYRLIRDSGVDITPEELETTIRCFGDNERINLAGLFLSAGYNISSTADIAYRLNIDTPLKYIGRGLKKGKRLAIFEDCVDAGSYSKGVVVNFAHVEEFCYNNEAPAINFGSCERHVSLYPKSSVVNFGFAGTFQSGRMPLINFGDIGDPQGFGHQGFGISIIADLGNIDDKLRQYLVGNSMTNLTTNGVENLQLFEMGFAHDGFEIPPSITNHFNKLRLELEKHKYLPFPECLGAGDVVEQFVGKTNGEFMEKLRGLLG